MVQLNAPESDYYKLVLGFNLHETCREIKNIIEILITLT